MPLLYDLGTGLYHTGIRAAAPFVPKARQWVEGRKGIWQRLEGLKERLHGCVWMHCASVGEFEQGLPVLEGIKAEHPDIPIVVTFFSPSGYHARRDHPIASHVEFLPPDNVANARRLLKVLRPRLALFVKYEFWFHHLDVLRSAGVPTFLVSAIFRRDQAFFKWYGGAYRAMLRAYRHLFVQDGTSQALLKEIGVENVTVTGDTRFDRVARIAGAMEELPILEAFKGAAPLLVCGSTWPEDETVLLQAGDLPKCAVVPHELDARHLRRIEETFPRPLVRWSELEGTTPENIAQVLGPEPRGTLVVDRMGLLSRIYRYADIAYVGGGFGDGIHNLLEAAVWGRPVIFGPEHDKFAEAEGLQRAGAGFPIKGAADLQRILRSFQEDPNALVLASAAAANYCRAHTGATDRILHPILQVLR
ncbi:MAG: glycosyltransferase N-terminal domain-containing protein [Flavobacteriales bacterium]|nr:3-deoxy-D-manno-octulosonic acid transferase [Flavobacteriales bacterium]